MRAEKRHGAIGSGFARYFRDLDFRVWEMFVVLAVTYLALVWTMSALIRLLERRLALPETN